MELIKKYTYSILTTENVIRFIEESGIGWQQWTAVLLFPNFFEPKKAKETELFRRKIKEYNELKKKLFDKIQAVIIWIEKDKTSEWILPEEIIELRDKIKSVTENIEIISSKFIFISNISLERFLYPNSIKEAVKDFEKVEIDLFKTIRDEFNTLMQDWLKFHEYELNQINENINSLSNTQSIWSSTLKLQSKILESYIGKIREFFK